MYIKKSDICTIPNLLTMLRIILVPIFIYYYMQDEQLIAAILILACGFTDFLDGYIARHTNAISEIGKMLDPFADKLLQFAIVFEMGVSIIHGQRNQYVLMLAVYEKKRRLYERCAVVW